MQDLFFTFNDFPKNRILQDKTLQELGLTCFPPLNGKTYKSELYFYKILGMSEEKR